MGQAGKSTKIIFTCISLIFLFVNPTNGEVEFAGGTGEPNNPYQISTPEQLISIGSDPNLLDKNFILTNNIDLDPNLPGGLVFSQAVIAPDTNTAGSFDGFSFSGNFDGAGHKILNLTIDGTGNYLGLFGRVTGKIMNLALEDVIVSGSQYIGGLVGLNSEQGIITNSHVTGNIFGIIYSGGLAGYNDGMIVNSYTCTEVTGINVLGGLTGDNEGSISGCYSTGKVTGGNHQQVYFGGFVGWNGGVISDSYAMVDVISRELSRNLGGLVGNNNGTIINCFAVGTILNQVVEDSIEGGLVGDSWERATSAAINCFWDIEISGIKKSNGGKGLTTAQMMDPNVYSLNGWADNPNWVLDPGNDYPRLSWEGKDGQTIPEPVTDWFDGSGTQEDPFIITTTDDLARIGTASILWDKVFILASDLDLTDVNIPRIGICKGTDFTGTFDGKKHTISNLQMGEDNIYAFSLGLFGHIGSGGVVRCLSLQNAQIRSFWMSDTVGILAGANEGTISECSTQGSVNCGGSSSYIGGLIGSNYGSISNCYSTANISGQDYCHALGGLVGANNSGAEINNCYSAGSIISNYYYEYQYLGGLIGYGFSYSIESCYFLSHVDGGGPDNGKGLPLTDEQMKQKDNYIDWDFENIWMICEGKDYPQLQWEDIQCE